VEVDGEVKGDNQFLDFGASLKKSENVDAYVFKWNWISTESHKTTRGYNQDR
jgi:hypothetical protein